jgi:hypothetical protein
VGSVLSNDREIGVFFIYGLLFSGVVFSAGRLRRAEKTERTFGQPQFGGEPATDAHGDHSVCGGRRYGAKAQPF